MPTVNGIFQTKLGSQVILHSQNKQTFDDILTLGRAAEGKKKQKSKEQAIPDKIVDDDEEDEGRGGELIRFRWL